MKQDSCFVLSKWFSHETGFIFFLSKWFSHETGFMFCSFLVVFS